MKPRGDGGAADGTNAGAAGELRRHCFCLRRSSRNACGGRRGFFGGARGAYGLVLVEAAPRGVRPRSGVARSLKRMPGVERRPLRAAPRNVPFAPWATADRCDTAHPRASRTATPHSRASRTATPHTRGSRMAARGRPSSRWAPRPVPPRVAHGSPTCAHQLSAPAGRACDLSPPSRGQSCRRGGTGGRGRRPVRAGLRDPPPGHADAGRAGDPTAPGRTPKPS